MNTKKIYNYSAYQGKVPWKAVLYRSYRKQGNKFLFVNSTIYRSEKEVKAYKKYITTDERMKQSFDFEAIMVSFKVRLPHSS